MAKKYCIAMHSVVSCHFGRRAKAEDIERPNFKNQIGGFVAWFSPQRISHRWRFSTRS